MPPTCSVLPLNWLTSSSSGMHLQETLARASPFQRRTSSSTAHGIQQRAKQRRPRLRAARPERRRRREADLRHHLLVTEHGAEAGRAGRQLHLLPHEHLQTALFRDADEFEVRDADGYADDQSAACAESDLYQSLCGVWWVTFSLRSHWEYVRDWVSNSPRVVVKNPLSPVEHPGGVGVNCEMFEAGLDQFVVSGATCDLPSRIRTLTASYRRETCHRHSTRVLHYRRSTWFIHLAYTALA